MSTIAFDGKTIAADTAQYNGTTFDVVQAQKVFRCGDELIAGAGDLACILMFVKWWQDGRIDAKPDFKDGAFSALVIGGKESPVLKFEQQLQGFEVGVPCAIGSGKEGAMGAMLAGATAEEAVKIAARLDPHTREPVNTYQLEPKHD